MLTGSSYSPSWSNCELLLTSGGAVGSCPGTAPVDSIDWPVARSHRWSRRRLECMARIPLAGAAPGSTVPMVWSSALALVPF